MTRDEMIAQATVLIDRAYEEGYHMGYMEAVDTYWKDANA